MLKYDVNYYYNLLKIQTEHAKEINDIRWQFVSQAKFNNRWPVVVDYGCGVGWFAAFKPAFVFNDNMDTFDIMPVPQTGIRHEKYDLLTMWDVLEHIPDFTELAPILRNTDFVAISLPIKPDDISWNKWKHFKPGEHLHYYSIDLLQALFNLYGFEIFKNSMPECPPRSDIHSILFARVEAL
jgi:hypothetical protein